MREAMSRAAGRRSTSCARMLIHMLVDIQTYKYELLCFKPPYPPPSGWNLGAEPPSEYQEVSLEASLLDTPYSRKSHISEIMNFYFWYPVDQCGTWGLEDHKHCVRFEIPGNCAMDHVSVTCIYLVKLEITKCKTKYETCAQVVSMCSSMHC